MLGVDNVVDKHRFKCTELWLNNYHYNLYNFYLPEIMQCVLLIFKYKETWKSIYIILKLIGDLSLTLFYPIK